MPDDPANGSTGVRHEASARKANGTGNGSRRGGWFRSLFRSHQGEATLRESLGELIEEREDDKTPIDESERALIENVLELRRRTIYDVMVPRADIVAVEAETAFETVIEIMTGKGHSRLPVYRESLDDVVGMVHIKDLVAWRGGIEDFQLANIQRRILFVSPSMQVLELLLEMRVKRSHMAIVVDEFGGVDGLVTIEDLVEEIVGEIEDEHDRATDPVFIRCADGSFEADARVEIEALEQTFGTFLDADEREDIDTLGGLVFFTAGHVPIRGELVSHPSGIEFEVLDADPRRIKRVRLRKCVPLAEQGE